MVLATISPRRARAAEPANRLVIHAGQGKDTISRNIYGHFSEHLGHCITPARKFRMLLHTNPTRERGECLGTRAGASEDM